MAAPYFIGINDVIETVDWAVYQNQYILTTWHWKVTNGNAANGPAELQAVLGQFAGVGGIVNKLRQIQVNTLTSYHLTMQKVYPSRWAPEISGAVPNGQLAGADSPVNSAVSIERRPAEAGKGFAGRVQVCGWDYTGFSNGRFVTPLPQVAAWVAFITALKTVYTSAGGVEYTPVLANLRKAPPTFRTIVTAVAADNKVRTMHRRTVGLGI